MDKSSDANGLQVGDLLPSFSAHALDGRLIRRQQYKGRRHLVLLFAHGGDCSDCAEQLRALARGYEACRAEQAEILAFVPADAAGAVALADLPYPVLVAPPALFARFGALASSGSVCPLLYIADRYGEVVWRAGGDSVTGHRVEAADVVPLVERMAMVCSL